MKNIPSSTAEVLMKQMLKNRRTKLNRRGKVRERNKLLVVYVYGRSAAAAIGYDGIVQRQENTSKFKYSAVKNTWKFWIKV